MSERRNTGAESPQNPTRWRTQKLAQGLPDAVTTSHAKTTRCAHQCVRDTRVDCRPAAHGVDSCRVSEVLLKCNGCRAEARQRRGREPRRRRISEALLSRVRRNDACGGPAKVLSRDLANFVERQQTRRRGRCARLRDQDTQGTSHSAVTVLRLAYAGLGSRIMRSNRSTPILFQVNYFGPRCVAEGAHVYDEYQARHPQRS